MYQIEVKIYFGLNLSYSLIRKTKEMIIDENKLKIKRRREELVNYAPLLYFIFFP